MWREKKNYCPHLDFSYVQIKYHEEFEKSKSRSDAPPPENRKGEAQFKTIWREKYFTDFSFWYVTADLEKQQNPQRSVQPAAEMQPAAIAPPSGGVRILHEHKF